MPEPAEDLTARLAEQIGRSVRASAVFGKPVERGGVTVIPVARARWVFGGGSGGDGQQQGGGGGGAGTVRPVGYIEVRKSGATYRPIRDWPRIGVTVAGVLAATGLITAKLTRRR
jgi:uncharacterized spore protein YtfJ